MSDRLQVRRVHAALVSAEMVQLKSIGDESDQLLICPTVREDVVIATVSVASIAEPFPAFISTTTIDLRPEPVHD